MTDVEVVVGQSEDGTTLTLRGELDAGAVEVLETCFAAIDPRVGGVLVDLEDVSFIDAAGVATLVALHREMELSLRRLEVCSAQGQVLRILELTGASRVLELT